MERLVLNLPTRGWVPKWLGVLTMFVVILPVIMLNGAYTGSSIDVSGALGVMSEDIMMAYYATSLGMAVAYPVVPKFRAVVTPKTLLLSDLLLQLGLCLVCARASDIRILTACSFLIGFLKAFLMLEFIVLVKPFFSPYNVRSQFYAYFYPLVFSGGQISSFLTAELAYRYHWQHMYLFMMILLLLAIVFVLAFFRYAKKPVRLPFSEVDFKSMLVASVSLLGLMYMLCYGKVLDWFGSPVIRMLAVACPFLLLIFLLGQNWSEKFYIGLVPLRRPKRLMGYFFMFTAMFFAGSSTLLTQYLSTVRAIDMVHVNALNLMTLPGFVAGSAVTYWWLKRQKWWFRRLVSLGLSCFTVYFLLLYLSLSPDTAYGLFFLPMFFKGMGMMVLFMGFGVYVVEDLDPKFMLSNTFFLITTRSVLAPIAAYAFFNNWLYRLQARSMVSLSSSFSWVDSLAAETFGGTYADALSRGYSAGDASLLAAEGLYSGLQKQAYVCGMRQIMAFFLVLSACMAVSAAFIRFHKTLKVKEVKAGDDMA